jgi:DHA2 family multidrug resistance protein
MNTAMSPDYAGDQLWTPNIVRHRPGDGADVADLGATGEIGTAVLATVITKRE